MPDLKKLISLQGIRSVMNMFIYRLLKGVIIKEEYGPEENNSSLRVAFSLKKWSLFLKKKQLQGQAINFS